MRTLWPILLTAAGYYVAGRLSLLLAIPPGYATAVWPPAGIALAAVLLGGYRVWPGILLGSFLVNVGTTFDASSTQAILRSVLVAGTIGGGASLQAVLAGWLIRRFIGYRNILTQEFGAIRLLLVGGPLTCLLNATLAVSTLWLAGLVPGDNYLFNWWTWWVGDSIGVMIFTPLVLVWALQPGRHWRRQQLAVTLPMLLMLAAVVLLFVYISKREEARIQTQFEAWTETYRIQLRQDVETYLTILQAVEGLFVSSTEVTRAEYRDFTERVIRRANGLLGLGWAEWLPHARRAEHEATQGGAFSVTEYGEQGNLRPADVRDEYVVVHYITPETSNARALGYDMASEPVRRAAIARARDTGEPVVTAPLRLVQVPDKPGIIIYLPVYYGSQTPATLEARRASFRGVAYAALVLQDMLQRSANSVSGTGMEVRIYDQGLGAPAEPIYSTNLPARAAFRNGGLQRSLPFKVAGRDWRLSFHVPPDYLVAHRSWQVWTILAVGLLFTALLGIFLLLAVGHAARIEAEVTERTAELNRVNADLQREIGERTRLQYEADQRAEQLADKNRELERFAYVVSHDLQAPLRGITGFTELLAQRYREQFDAEGREFLQYIIDGAAQMRRMIADILALSRVGTGELQHQPVDVAAVVEQVRAALRWTSRTRRRSWNAGRCRWCRRTRASCSSCSRT
jgi:CHASE1-domain containing sensor protein